MAWVTSSETSIGVVAIARSRNLITIFRITRVFVVTKHDRNPCVIKALAGPEGGACSLRNSPRNVAQEGRCPHSTIRLIPTETVAPVVSVATIGPPRLHSGRRHGCL